MSGMIFVLSRLLPPFVRKRTRVRVAPDFPIIRRADGRITPVEGAEQAGESAPIKPKVTCRANADCLVRYNRQNRHARQIQLDSGAEN